ncbi:L-seryl-tRNA(Sec) selenium transferase [Baileyella intestinalis]|uniref:L-seryl-tRNA(Sec) selenium transferase n=1 Tax=Baileyella intestinalis TaxID=2606709 RepID=UPI0022E63EBE|nr:L-seryl-tRNA(Sec) selenium transferase [Baileyella intestinalis]
MKKNEALRALPKIDEVLKQHLISDFLEKKGKAVVTDAARKVVDARRSAILSMSDEELNDLDPETLAPEVIQKAVADEIESMDRNKLYPVINCTGTILHTNLGRAPLCRDAVENVARVSEGYSDLEYDVKEGRRGSRHSILQDILCEITGTEDVMMVNNNASATMLVLSSMAAGGEAVVSRGELVEIGGAFRIPDIMEQSGAVLREVGTTNKTKPSDYENAINEDTRVLMKVHTSNYKIMGFTEEASLEELVEIGKKHDLPVIFDMGNGLMVDMSEYGLDEPNVPAALATGIDVILFSGDKLLGGPQAGIIAGKKEYIEKMKKHPLARALRVDKMTFAAMEETLKKYRDRETALRDIPVLHMISQPSEEMKARALMLAGEIREMDPSLKLEVVEVKDQIGGGSAPMVYLPGWAVAVTSDSCSADSLERMLRKNKIPVIARINEDRLLLCVRTMRDQDVHAVAGAFEK